MEKGGPWIEIKATTLPCQFLVNSMVEVWGRKPIVMERSWLSCGGIENEPGPHSLRNSGSCPLGQGLTPRSGPPQHYSGLVHPPLHGGGRTIFEWRSNRVVHVAMPNAGGAGPQELPLPGSGTLLKFTPTMNTVMSIKGDYFWRMQDIDTPYGSLWLFSCQPMSGSL